MSRFFEQLLTRAQGDAGPSRVRPQVTVPWAGSEDNTVTDVPDGSALIAGSPPQSAPASGAVAAATASRRAVPATAAPPVAWPAPPHTAERPAAVQPAPSLPAPMASVAAVASATSAASERAAASVTSASPPAVLPPATPPTLMPAPLVAQPTSPPPRLQAPAASSAHFNPPGTHTVPPAPAAPPAPRASRLASQQVTTLANAAREDKTIVHVSIGRVELIAQPPATPPRARPAPRGGSVPLADYLRGKPR